jgi:hypothetical protein
MIELREAEIDVLVGREAIPGSLLSQMSALASPSTFVWSRFMDAALNANRTLGAR